MASEPLDLRTLICAPIKGQTTADKLLELPAKHFLRREAHRLQGGWSDNDLGLGAPAEVRKRMLAAA